MVAILRALGLAITVLGGVKLASSGIGASATFLSNQIKEFLSFFVPKSYLGMIMYVGVLSICLFFIFSGKKRPRTTILFVLLAMIVASCLEKGFLGNFSTQYSVEEVVAENRKKNREGTLQLSLKPERYRVVVLERVSGEPFTTFKGLYYTFRDGVFYKGHQMVELEAIENGVASIEALKKCEEDITHPFAIKLFVEKKIAKLNLKAKA